MSRPIDADALIARLEDDLKHMEMPLAKMFAYGAINDIKHEPTIAVFSQWIPCSERLPEQQYIDGVPLYQEFFVTVAERWPGEDWKYNTDIGSIPGDYIDCFWGTINDWDEGQEVHVIAWMPLPEPWRGQDGTD